MVNSPFKLMAWVSSDSPAAIAPVLGSTFGKGSVKRSGAEFIIEAELDGEDVKELNRNLLSALRKTEKRTRMRSEWTSKTCITYKFFDYVLKKTTK